MIQPTLIQQPLSPDYDTVLISKIQLLAITELLKDKLDQCDFVLIQTVKVNELGDKVYVEFMPKDAMNETYDITDYDSW